MPGLAKAGDKLIASTVVDLCNTQGRPRADAGVLDEAMAKAVVSGDSVLAELMLQRSEEHPAAWSCLARFHTKDALADIEAAAAWYEAPQPGLGADFARTARGVISSLTEHPLIYRVRDRRRGVRGFLTPRLPYRVFYRVRQASVTVFAAIHAARHDRPWRRRL